ncbi:MAG: endonuclease domain-containing protein [Alphaproteobacteria bacterium]|nr:MAG: endonuclease domain-containing protein [Alphaproteobacteria bacterium]
MTRRPIDSFRRETARRLRASSTAAEILLWRKLRLLETKGTHFRRQVPIGPYVADFACLASRLVIEIDGSQHGDEPNRLRDENRTRWLESEGYRVVRFWNNDITQNPAGVLDLIYAALYGSRDTEPKVLKHRRKRGFTPPRRASRADPPPPGEGSTERAARKVHS